MKCRLRIALPLAASALPAFAAGSPASETTGPGLFQGTMALLLVLILIFALAWAARRMGLKRPVGNSTLRVVSSTMVGPRERVVMLEVGSTCLVLGVTGSQISLLHQLPATELPQTDSGQAAHDALGQFARQLRQALGRQDGSVQ